ncbi:MAG: hypothetical protein E7B42_01250 [Peptoniphilus harei]|nr:hypothetical protein [Peptoniphilus harei]
MKYKKKPVVIEAIKYEKEHIGRALDFCNKLRYNPHDNEYYVDTLEGCMKATEGDYIIKGVNGEFYPCKPDIFKKTYEKLDAENLGKTEEAKKRKQKNLFSVIYHAAIESKNIKTIKGEKCKEVILIISPQNIKEIREWSKE